MRISLAPEAGKPHGQAWIGLGARGGPRAEVPFVTFVERVFSHSVEFSRAHGRHLLLTESGEMPTDGATARLYMVCARGSEAAVRLSERAPPLGERLRCVTLQT